MTKQIEMQIKKECVICGKIISVIIYANKSYRGGHYFGKVPIHTKKALYNALKAGYKETKIGKHTFSVLKKSPVVYKNLEYWECSKCYWKK